jgi:hypothetical protein
VIKRFELEGDFEKALKFFLFGDEFLELVALFDEFDAQALGAFL